MMACSFNVAAEIYKCKTSKGKVIYNEVPCEDKPSQTVDISDNTMDGAKLQQEFKSSRNQPSGNQPSSTTSLMSVHDKEILIRGNVVSSKSTTAYSEKISDALNENAYLNRVSVRSMSFDNALLRKNLKVDLDSQDQTKRIKAMSSLNALYGLY